MFAFRRSTRIVSFGLVARAEKRPRPDAAWLDEPPFGSLSLSLERDHLTGGFRCLLTGHQASPSPSVVPSPPPIRVDTGRGQSFVKPARNPTWRASRGS